MPDAPPPIRVLHLEDSPRDAEIMRDLLDTSGPAYDVVHVDCRAAFESTLAEGAFAVVICDFNLADIDGLTALRLVKDRFPDVPVIIVSGAIDPGEAVECLKEGATDYLLKQRLERLPSAVIRAIEEAEQRRQRLQIDTKLRESEERYRQLVESASEVFYKVLTPGDPLKGEVQFVSWSAKEITGYAPEEFIRDTTLWLSLIHPDDLPAWAESTGALARLERTTRFYRMRNRAGEYRWIEDRVVPLVGHSGALSGYQGVARFIWTLEESHQ